MASVRLTKRIKAFSQLVPTDSRVDVTMDMPRWRQPKLVAGHNHWGAEIFGEWAPGMQMANCLEWLWTPPTGTLTDHSGVQSCALNVTSKYWPKIL